MRVQTGCRDCAMCTGHAFTGFGRTWGRGIADLATLGISNLARRKCKGCAHPMAEHRVEPQQVVVIQQQPAPLMVPAGWYPDEEDRSFVVWWDGRQWHPESRRHYSQVALNG